MKKHLRLGLMTCLVLFHSYIHAQPGNWTYIGPDPLYLGGVNDFFSSITFADSLTGYATDASNPRMMKTTDGGVTWTLATMTDGPNEVVQGPGSAFALPDGNAATSVVWNPVRQLFVAAVRFHGYYESADGITFTRMSDQPALSLDPLSCPTNSGQTGSNGKHDRHSNQESPPHEFSQVVALDLKFGAALINHLEEKVRRYPREQITYFVF